MTRRRGESPPDHPLDTHDTGRDHLTGPGMKNGSLHGHSWQKNVETAAAPSTVQEDSMSVTVNPTRHRRPELEWTPEHDPETGEHFAMGPSIWEAGIDIYTSTDAHNGPRAYDANGTEIPAGDLLRYACRLLQIHDALRTAQRQHELASRPEAQA